MHKKKKQIYLLIGPKGSGKSFIGTLFQSNFNIPFMRVENWVLEVRKGRSLDDQKYIKDAFHTIEEKVRQALREVDQLVFESTGLTEHFDEPLLEHIFTFSRKITIWNNVTYKLPLYYE